MGVIMEMEEAKEKAKDVMDKVVVSSKDAFSKAGNAIQKFGDKSVLKIEIMQLKSKRKNAYSKRLRCRPRSSKSGKNNIKLHRLYK